jgi:hypothetical protein
MVFPASATPPRSIQVTNVDKLHILEPVPQLFDPVHPGVVGHDHFHPRGIVLLGKSLQYILQFGAVTFAGDSITGDDNDHGKQRRNG